MTQPYVVVLGPPAAGKSTQAGRIADEFDLEYVDAGDVLRANEAMETDFGTVREFVEQGELVPDPVVNEVVGEVLAGADGAVLDGYPRTLEQAEFLEGIADLDAVVFLDASQETIDARLTGRRVCEDCGEEYRIEPDALGDDEECPECGGELVRPDDATPDVIAERVGEYEDETLEVVEFYRQRGMVTAVDGDPPPDEVWRDVREVVEEVV